MSAQAFVAISHVADGSMHNRNDPLDTNILDNREEWLLKQGIDISQTTRVRVTYTEPEEDFCRYREVSESNRGEGMLNSDNEPADALVTTQPGLALFLPIADCVATTIFDPENGVLMLAHLGRHSIEQYGGVKTIQYLREKYGSNPAKLQVWLSPTVNKEVYPILKLDNKGMKEALYEQLEEAGIDFENVVDNKDDTATNPNYFSFSEFKKGNKPVDGCYAMVAVMKEAV